MKHLTIQSDDPIAVLDDINATVALEAFNLRSVVNRLADMLPAMTHAYRQFAHNHKSDKLDLTPPDINLTILDKALKTANYLDLEELAVPVPQGHKGNMVDYIAAMSDSIEFSNGIVARMTEFNQLISALISSKSARQNTRDMSTATNKVEHERKALVSRLGESARVNSRAARRKLGITYRSMGEVSMACELTIKLVRDATTLNLGEINTLIKNSVELLDELERRALEGTIEDLSPQMYRSLASATLTMARDGEFHALLCYKTWEVKDCMELTAKELIKTLRY